MEQFNSTHNTVKLRSRSKVRKIRIKPTKTITIAKDMSDVNCIQVIKEQTRILRGDEEESDILKTKLSKSHDLRRCRRQEGD